MTTLMKRKIPPMLSFSIKIFNDHYNYPRFEARAITALRTGNLIFKNWCPWKIRRQHAGDPFCMFQPCGEKDSLLHVMECDYYTTKFINKDGPTKDWSNYLVKLHQERMERFNQPLISCEGWSQGDWRKWISRNGKCVWSDSDMTRYAIRNVKAWKCKEWYSNETWNEGHILQKANYPWFMAVFPYKNLLWIYSLIM